MKKPKLPDQEKGLLKLKNDPALFVREVLGAEPKPWQSVSLQAIHDHNRVAIKSGHGVGKSCFLSWMVLWFLSTASSYRFNPLQLRQHSHRRSRAEMSSCNANGRMDYGHYRTQPQHFHQASDPQRR